ncbi:hypothetical protein [Aquimarina sp. MAR_2010_214]|uniref:hypothetical protein n=1 Tax=Aquimarina sp. MAR_2010_214 TaxID=1250026 RepID=UPI001177501D|nr:hypothetical protein [Aquimarina sp. MAR_2010_214]
MKNKKTFYSVIIFPLLTWILLLVFLANPIVESFHHLIISHSNTNSISSHTELHSSTPKCVVCNFVMNRKVFYFFSNPFTTEATLKSIVHFTPSLDESIYAFDLLIFPLANSPPLS